jgi:predicted Zn-dependent peptidase
MFPAGLAKDGSHQGELARAVAETVREGGRRSRDAEYTRVLEQRGARSSLFLGSARVDFCTEVPAHELPLALWLESGRHRPYAFTAENFAERLSELALGREAERVALLHRKTYALAFPDLAPQPAGGALLDAARRFHTEHYRLEGAVLAIAGDFEPGAIRAKVEELFAGPSLAARPPAPQSLRQTSPRFMALEDPELIAPIHERGWAVPGASDRDHAAVQLAAELLAGNSDSVLQQSLVAPGIVRSVSHRFEARGTEALFAVTLVLASNQNATDVVGLVDQAVHQLATGPLRREQLDRARRRLAVEHAFRLQSAIEQARWLGERAIAGVGLSPVDAQAAIEAATAEDVRRVVLEHLSPTRRVVVELLPKEARDPFRVGASRFHVVTEGEALSRIARREGTTVDALLELNELDAKGKIRPGQKLKLPPSKPRKAHQVKKGDTLIGIAKRHGVSVEELRRENRLKKGGMIRAGEQLWIPRSQPSSKPR